MSSDIAWNAIFERYSIESHDFAEKPFIIAADDIKAATKHLEKTSEKEVRILCKQDTRESRPTVFKKRNLFVLPIANGTYAIVQGEGYVDIPPINHDAVTQVYRSQLDFRLDTATVGNSEMQHLDFAYAASLVRTFMGDDSLVMTIRGRKFTPEFTFSVNGKSLSVSGVQTEVDAGYEGRNQVVLIEAKGAKTTNTIIRQLFYPFRQWSTYTKKPITTLFFAKDGQEYLFWKFVFSDINDYNSIQLIDARKFQIVE